MLTCEAVPPAPLHLDLTDVSCSCTNHALEVLHKAMADPPDAGIFALHENPWLRDSVEYFTLQGSTRLRAVLDGMSSLMRRGELMRKATAMDAAENAFAIAALSNRDPRTFDLDDWLKVVDWLVLHNFPDTFTRGAADYLAARSAVAAAIKAHIGEAPVVPAPYYSPHLPTSAADLLARMTLTPVQALTLQVSRARVADQIVDIGEQTRHRLKRLVLDHFQRAAAGEHPASAKVLEQRMFEEFSTLNRDWRRIAVTEAGETAEQSVIASCAPGTRVRRWEFYTGACDFCRSLNGRVFTVVDPKKEDKDGWTEVWVGKTNIGRSAAARRRVGDELVARTPEERWWPAAGLQHPNCRGGWTVIGANLAIRDQRTQDYLESLVSRLVPSPPPS